MSSKNMIQSALCHTTRPTRTNNTTSSSSMHMINLYVGNMTTQKKACKNQVFSRLFRSIHQPLPRLLWSFRNQI